jgi:hypothetical protein
MKTPELVIQEIKELIKSKGYIYALCMMIFEDFHVNPEELHQADNYSKLSVKEASLLLGFLIQNKINFTPPDNPMDLIDFKKKTYDLLEELHQSFMIPFIKKMKDVTESKIQDLNITTARKEFFGNAEMMAEPIFYSGTGVYDFQYLEFLEKKYKYDKEWLLQNKTFDLKEVQQITIKIKEVLHAKSNKVNLTNQKDLELKTSDILGKSRHKDKFKKGTSEMLKMFQFYQYVELFFEDSHISEEGNKEEIMHSGWNSFYKGLIDLFIVNKSDLLEFPNAISYLENFSIAPNSACNNHYKGVGSFNSFSATPILHLDNDKYFVPIPFLLYEAVYESPFYWMTVDKEYEPEAGKNRGKVGEEITYDFLVKVFGKDKVFKSVRISSKKGQDDTDIDVLCILGSKALCVQVKSKKLILLSRSGNDEQLKKDFKGAVQDAYNQGLVSRQKILERGCRFYNGLGEEIKLSEEIDEVYILGITTENYPSLTHQAHMMLDKNEADPYPLFSTTFDLELLTHYLSDPYDLLYYIRQRTSLMDVFKADEEITFLGYHLERKLWKLPEKQFMLLDTSFAQAIDRNYYPVKAGIEVSDEGDSIKKRWRNKDFEELCNQLKSLKLAKITDIIFCLMDYSSEGRERLINQMKRMKVQTQTERKRHNFSLPPNKDEKNNRFGITYWSHHNNDIAELSNCLLDLCEIRKYKSKGDIWVGLGSLVGSPNIIDYVVFNDDKWVYNKELEEKSNVLLLGKGKGQLINYGNKIGRNDMCFCGSGFKYKKCCGKK